MPWRSIETPWAQSYRALLSHLPPCPHPSSPSISTNATLLLSTLLWEVVTMDLRGGREHIGLPQRQHRLLWPHYIPFSHYAPSMVVLSCAVLGGSNSNFDSKRSWITCSVKLWRCPQNEYLVFCEIVFVRTESGVQWSCYRAVPLYSGGGCLYSMV